MGQAVIALTHAEPVPGGGGLTELRVVQPVADAPRRRSPPHQFPRHAQSRGRHHRRGRALARCLGRGLRGPAPPSHLRPRADADGRRSLRCGRRRHPPFTCRRQRLRSVRHRRPDDAATAALSGQPPPGADSGAGGRDRGRGARSAHRRDRPVQWRRAGAAGPMAPSRRPVRRLLGAAGDGRAGDRRRAPGVPRRSALAGAPGRGGDRPVEVEPLGALGASARGPAELRPGGMGPDLGGGRFLRLLQPARRRCMGDGAPPSPLSIRADLEAGGAADLAVPVSAAAPGELDLRDHSLDHPHRWILGSGTRARARSACGRCWRSRTDGSARSAAGSSTSSRCMAGTTSGAAPWACVSRSAAGPIGWDATARR